MFQWLMRFLSGRTEPPRPCRVRPIDALMDADLTPEEQRVLVDKWLAWKTSCTLTSPVYTPGDIRHQKE